MTILGGSGFVGIGLPNPLFRLDVQDDINVNTNLLNNAYHINGFPVLQIFGLRNLFVGQGAGFNNTGGGAIDNTFMGFNAGVNNVNGDRNTYLGSRAGQTIANGRFNTFIGSDAGLNLVGGNSNTFVGEHSGYLMTSGSGNSFFGSHSGQGQPGGTGNRNTFLGLNCGPSVINADENTFAGAQAGNVCNNGDRNSFFGTGSGAFTTSGSLNSCLGFQSGRFNTTGDSNTYIGRIAGPPTTTFGGLFNSTAIGNRAFVRTNNTMILGSNQVNVGIGLSNDPVGPQNKLEINFSTPGTDLTPNTCGGTGNSGLRFRDLTSNSVPCPTPPTLNTLSVDQNGDVILIQGVNPVGFGQACAAPGNPGQLTQTTEVPTNGFNFVFTNNLTQPNTVNNVGIGLVNGNCSPTARLDVLQTSSSTGTTGINVLNTDASNSTNGSIGLKSVVSGSNAFSRNIAGWFENIPGFGLAGYAIITPPQKGATGLGTLTPTVQLQVGDNGDGTSALANAWNVFSDATLKNNINTITNALNTINNLRGVTFNWTSSGTPSAGFIAQEVDTVIPVIVYTDSLSGLKSLDYSKIVPYLVEAIKILSSKVDSLGGNNMRTANNGSYKQTIELSSDIILYQNMPNPFGDETVINYYLPDNVTNARMIFYDETGRMIKEELITNRGNGSITIQASNLSAGIYSYSLEANGKNVQTRKMQKVK